MVFNNVSTPIGRSFIDVKFSRNKHYGQVRQMSRSLSSISLGNRPMERFFEEQSADDFTDIFIHDITEQVPPKPFKCVPVIHVLWSLGLLLLYCIFINSRIRAYFNSPS
ncbi:hypothetical protein FO519_008529 [Halicephalobus sp. NKZ332]|nr:hypothetical protein FO519_008529 [Halicephalobus sp. NKZ332]